ncbi:MAG: hypothetical protein ACYDHP_06970 [Ferrimicrobium sp.]
MLCCHLDEFGLRLANGIVGGFCGHIRLGWELGLKVFNRYLIVIANDILCPLAHIVLSLARNFGLSLNRLSFLVSLRFGFALRSLWIGQRALVLGQVGRTCLGVVGVGQVKLRVGDGQYRWFRSGEAEDFVSTLTTKLAHHLPVASHEILALVGFASSSLDRTTTDSVSTARCSRPFLTEKPLLV